MAESRVCLIGSRLVAEEEARISALDRGFLYGDGIFETLRVYAGHPFHLAQHLRRMERSAAFFGLRFPPVNFQDAVTRVVSGNGFCDAVVRITLSRGTQPRGPRPGKTVDGTLLVQARPLPSHLPVLARDGLRGQRLPWPLRARGLILQTHKTLAYLASVQGLGATPSDVEPILENTDGQVAEGATTNLFWVRGNTLFTPHPDAGCLPGVTRAIVLDNTPELRRAEGFFPTAELIGSAEAFVTNSTLEVTPLVAIDGQAIGDGRPGTVTRELQATYRDLVDQEMER